MSRFVISNINIIDVRNHRVLRNSSVEVNGEHIVSVGKSIPGVAMIDGQGGWLIPGLFEMHGHFYTPGNVDYDINKPNISGYVSSLNASLPLYLANGVTTMVSKNDEDAAETYAAKRAIEAGSLSGPRILTAGICISREPKILPAIVAARSVEEMLEAYRAQRERIDCVKVYISMTADWLSILANEAHADGLKVYGHIDAMTAEEAVRAGIDGLEHGVPFMPEFKTKEKIPADTPVCFFASYANFDPRSDKAKRLLDALLEHDTALTPTVSCLEAFNSPDMADYLTGRNVWKFYDEAIRSAIRSKYERQVYSPGVKVAKAYFEEFLARQAEFMAAFHRAGGRIFAGTDPSVIPVFGGMTMAREAQHLQSFGMTAHEILAAMTINSAKETGLEGVTGAIEPGLQADMVLLKHNPLVDLRNLESVRLVVKSGNLYDPAALHKAAEGMIKE